MRKMRRLFIGMLVVFSVVLVNAAGGVTLSKNSITLKKGDTTSFTINASNAAGVVEISSSDTNVVTVDTTKHFFDTTLSGGSELKVNVTAINSGTATINVLLSDMATYDLEELTGTKVIEVVVEDNITDTEDHTDDNGHNEEVIDNVPKTASNIKGIVLFTAALTMLSGVAIVYYVSKKKSIKE